MSFFSVQIKMGCYHHCEINQVDLSEIRGRLNKEALRIVFFGTPEFAAHSLQLIARNGYQVVAVVTAPDKPAGRGMKLKSSAVKESATALGLKVLQPINLKDAGFQEELRELKPDLGIVIAFRMLPMAVWSMPRLGTFNLHASLLPRYRGAAPINHALINGESETGVTTFFLKHEIDTGDIVLQEKVKISEDDNAGSLHDKLMMAGGQLVLKTLQLIDAGKWPETPQQISADLPAAPKLNRAFCEITGGLTMVEAHNKIRGLSPYPGAWIATDQGTIKLYKSKITERPAGEKEGLFVENRRLLLNCSDGCLEILELQPEGKPRMSSGDYINGLANL